MKKSEIRLQVELDKDNIPEKIFWDADEKEQPGPSETKSVSLSLWDQDAKNTLRIDLWAKDMSVDEMKQFYVDCIGGMAQSVLNATGDEYMSSQLSALGERFVEHLKKEIN